MNRISSLDGIRAVSFMIVFISHAKLAALLPKALLREALLRGDLGVTIFFFLSGFIITTSCCQWL